MLQSGYPHHCWDFVRYDSWTTLYLFSTLIQVCYLHTGKNVGNADERDYARLGKQVDIDTMRRYVRDHFPGLYGEQPAILETCMFTVCETSWNIAFFMLHTNVYFSENGH